MIKITPVHLAHKTTYTFAQLFDRRLGLSGKFLRPFNLDEPRGEFNLVCMVDGKYQHLLVFADDQVSSAPVIFTCVNSGLWHTRSFEVIEHPITITLSNESATIN